ncbi:MAG: glycosyltransferase family 2 protein [Exiguobacterium profundum]|nr:MAG: glycosyltransferase family 2 protein [Exiguobacterium profundum]
MATVSEPPQLVVAFVAHALDMGAAEVCLYLDEPAPDLTAMLRPNPRVRLVDCDAAHWQGLGMARPWVPLMRQRANLKAELDAARLPWVLHIDADEFLWGPGDIGAILAAQPTETGFVLVPVAERVHSGPADPGDVFSGRFRRQVGGPAEEVIARIDGPAAPFLRQGMAGYAGERVSSARADGSLPAFMCPTGPAGRCHAAQPPDPAFRRADASGMGDEETAQDGAAARVAVLSRQPQRHAQPAGGRACGGGRRYGGAGGLCADQGACARARGGAGGAWHLAGCGPGPAYQDCGAVPGLRPDHSAAALDGHAIGYRPRRDVQALKHGLRAMLA